jgi:hypothetical protein
MRTPENARQSFFAVDSVLYPLNILDAAVGLAILVFFLLLDVREGL